MRSLFFRYARVLVAAALVVGLIGLWRLGRQFPAAAESPGLLVPFLMPVLALALEAGALVALSVTALGLASRAGVEAPATSRAGVLLLGLLLATLAVAELVPRGTEKPGSFANVLVERALDGCDEGKALVPVPLLGLNARCSQPPRVEGPVPGVAASQLAMRKLRFADDLRSVHIEGLELSVKRALSLKLRVDSARIVGLAPWTRSPRLSPLHRFFVLAVVGVALLGVLAWWPSQQAPEATAPSRWGLLLRVLLAASPGAVAAALVISLDQRQASPAWYALSALAGIALQLAQRLLVRYAPGLLGSLGAF